MEPKRPTNIPTYSDICLRALHEQNLGSKISLGGALGLMHYLAASDTSASRANMALQTHLARIEQRRPLFQISDPVARESAQKVRAWFKKEFSDALKRLD
jgi:hypothetical protein